MTVTSYTTGGATVLPVSPPSCCGTPRGRAVLRSCTPGGAAVRGSGALSSSPRHCHRPEPRSTLSRPATLSHDTHTHCRMAPVLASALWDSIKARGALWDSVGISRFSEG